MFRGPVEAAKLLGVLKTPETLKILKFFMVTFPIYQFSNILSQNIGKKFLEYLPFGLLKIIAFEK